MTRRFVPSILLTLALPCVAPAQSHPNIPAPVSDWGCEVRLCLSNPNGPTAVAECVPPIQRLWRHLARGRSFPACRLATGPNGNSYARPTFNHYDACPPGTEPVPAGQVAELATPAAFPAPLPLRSGAANSYVSATYGSRYFGIGDGTGYQPDPSDAGVAAYKVCAAGSRGTSFIVRGDNEETIHLYDAIYIAPPQPSPHLIDVYIDDQLWHQVRW